MEFRRAAEGGSLILTTMIPFVCGKSSTETIWDAKMRRISSAATCSRPCGVCMINDVGGAGAVGEIGADEGRFEPH